MATDNQDVTIFRGTDVSFPVAVLDANGQDLPLTGIDVFYSVAKSPGGSPKLLIGEPAITTQDNVATIPITAAQSLTLKVTRDDGDSAAYYHEVYLVQNGIVAVVMTGTLTVRASQAAHYEAPEP